MIATGAAQISAKGDVNVSRMSKGKCSFQLYFSSVEEDPAIILTYNLVIILCTAERLTGPGGFIDISSCTKDVYFMAAFTAVGLDVEADDGKLNIKEEGKVKKFVSQAR
jgi:hypothetical protein